MAVSQMRTDSNRNPTAFTTDLARQAGLQLVIDYESGSPFPPPSNLVTARILGDPIEVTIRLLDTVGYYTSAGLQRWTYIAIPHFIWNGLTHDQKRDVIGFHYKHEGGTAMRDLIPDYGAR